MNDTPEIPKIEAIRDALALLDQDEMQALARDSGASISTLLKIRGGHIKNPGIDTVAQFYLRLMDIVAAKRESQA